MYHKALASLSVLFFMLGFITCLNDILLPYFKKVFHLDYGQAAMIQASFFGAYGLFAIPGSRFVENFGYKRGIITGFILVAIGCLLFYPASSLNQYHWFLCSLFIIAIGIVLLQVAANPYVSLIGPAETSSSRLSLVQAFFSLGTAVAPFFGAVLILQNKGNLSLPYFIIAGVAVLVAVMMSQLNFPKTTHLSETSTWKEVLRHPNMMLGMIGIFLYVGAEVSIGSFLVNYVIHISPMKATEAASFVAFYWATSMAGRFLGSYTLKEFPPGSVLVTHALVAVSLILISINSHGMVAVYSMILVGFCNSIMFPTIFTLSIKGLNGGTHKASGLLTTSIVGGSLIPVLTGQVADAWGLRMAMSIPLFCYLYVWLFGFVNRPKGLSR